MNTLDLDAEANGEAENAGSHGVLDEATANAGSKTPLEPGVLNEDVEDLDGLPDRAVVNKDGSITLSLRFPGLVTIRQGGKERTERYETLTFHRMNGADLRAIAAASDIMTNVVAFSKSTRIRQALMNVLYDVLDSADIIDAGRCLGSFLPSGRKTGRSS